MPRQSDPPQKLSRFWNGYVDDCADSVTRFRRITSALPAGPARTWLDEIAQRLDAELEAVRRLAIVGDSIEPARFRVREEPAKRIAQRLDASRSAFADAVSQAAEVAEQVALDPAHSDVRANLEVLSRQAAKLAVAPAPPEPEPEPPRRWWRRRED
ncbi:MAG TPA: hypothetical protein VD903_14970 [Pseudonocardia sp.]|nr:hypothetical protein [Pseudonocardia sp.]